jgi:dipeptidase
MCDTLVALAKATQSGNLIFGKNSDREPQEAQEILWVPAKNPTSQILKCTYLEIPQVSETYECILSKPFQMWGAEMGVNEFNVCIGNEAVFTNVKFDKSNSGLTGMDLLRLALERSKSAEEAREIIIFLLQQFGQNACGGYQNKDFYYHNSFLIADLDHAFILETSGKSWAWKKVALTASISNILTIEEDYDQIFIADERQTFSSWFAQKSGFKSRFSDILFTYFGKGDKRKACTGNFLQENQGAIDVHSVIEILRTHNLPDTEFHPKKANSGSICMHATGLTNPSDTTGSMVAELRKEGFSSIWLSGTPHPCLSIYVPFYLGTSKSFLVAPTSNPDKSLWWKAKELHSLIDQDRQSLFFQIREELNIIQNRWIQQDQELLAAKSDKSILNSFSEDCYMEYQAWIADKLSQLSA